MKDIMTKLFTICIQKDDSWYIAKCLDNNVASQGGTIEEAIENLREAVALYYEDETLPILTQIFVTTMEVAL